MRDAVLVAATIIIGLGLTMILWRELSSASQRRRVGPVRDAAEVVAPVLATIALLWSVWIL